MITRKLQEKQQTNWQVSVLLLLALPTSEVKYLSVVLVLSFVMGCLFITLKALSMQSI
jgi:hypothetical protein